MVHLAHAKACSFYKSSAHDISIRQGHHETGARIRRLNPLSDSTQAKVAHGKAIEIHLSRSKEVAVVEVKELEKAIKQLKSAEPEVSAALKTMLKRAVHKH